MYHANNSFLAGITWNKYAVNYSRLNVHFNHLSTAELRMRQKSRGFVANKEILSDKQRRVLNGR